MLLQGELFLEGIDDGPVRCRARAVFLRPVGAFVLAIRQRRVSSEPVGQESFELTPGEALGVDCPARTG